MSNNQYNCDVLIEKDKGSLFHKNSNGLSKYQWQQFRYIYSTRWMPAVLLKTKQSIAIALFLKERYKLQYVLLFEFVTLKQCIL